MLDCQKNIKKSFSYLLIFLFIFKSILPVKSSYAEVMPVNVLSFQKGICYATWQKNTFASKYSEKCLNKLKDIGVEYVQIIVTQYQKKYNSTKIRPTAKTPSDRSLVKAIQTAHQLGLKVMLKPHIDLTNKGPENYWRADIGFYNKEDWIKWFSDYKKFISHYAEIAQQNNVDIFCVGTELTFTTQKAESWFDVIKTVRGIYRGTLIYAANWDNYMNVKFWKALDLVGIDAYFPLAYDSNPTLEDIKEGWKRWKYEIETWQTKVQKPIVFTEIGYPSSSHAASEPWSSGNGRPDADMQAKCYRAFFESVYDSPWLQGVYWWEWGPNYYGKASKNNHFTPMGKLAENIMENNYKDKNKDEIRFKDIEKTLEAIKPVGLQKALMPNAVGASNLALAPINERIPVNDIKSNIDNIKEVVSFSNGSKYEGQCKDGYPHGEGVYTKKNGEVYEGEFKNGLKHGKGVNVWKNGNKYEGKFKDGYYHGKGIFTWGDGSKYEGDYVNGTPSGIGVEVYKNGNIYEGEFSGGYPGGRGVYTEKSGNRYEGEFKSGLKHGKGKYIKTGGEIWEGDFKNGYAVGKGTYVDKKGNKSQRTFK